MLKRQQFTTVASQRANIAVGFQNKSGGGGLVVPPSSKAGATSSSLVPKKQRRSKFTAAAVPVPPPPQAIPPPPPPEPSNHEQHQMHRAYRLDNPQPPEYAYPRHMEAQVNPTLNSNSIIVTKIVIADAKIARSRGDG